MCGINGIYAFHPAAGRPSEGELLRTRDAMRKRGPDGEGAWWSDDRRCGFGHRRLSIIDLSERANQPMASGDGRFVIIFNGEIYNYPELRAGLITEGAELRTTSDTEVILHLYARDREKMLPRLRGMFALAIWDNLKRGLFLARDLYGIKPLYMANDGQSLRFASQVKALLAGGQVSHEPEPAGIAGFHLFGNVPEPFTLYRDIHALPAGHSQWVDQTGLQESRPFANLAVVLAEGGHDPAPPEALQPRLQAALLDSVRAHMVSDVEVGIFLSAGIDSGALLGLMRDAGQSGVRAITLAFDQFRGTAEDEAPLAAEVAARYEARHIVRRIGEQEFATDLPAIFEAMDQPSIDGVNSWFVAKAAKEAGLKVAVSGLGGDELLAGYPSFAQLPRWRRRFGPLAAVPGLGRFAHGMMRALLPGTLRTQPKRASLLEYANSWPGLYLLRRGLFLPRELPGILGAEMAREGLRRLRPLDALAQSLIPDPGSDVAKICLLESAHYMRNQLLRDADWAGMAHSLEIRTPLVDTTLLRAMAPSVATLKPGQGKVALAHAPATPLPPDILARAKTGFGVPTRSWTAGTDMPESAAKGLTSRRWSRVVLNAFIPQTAAA